MEQKNEKKGLKWRARKNGMNTVILILVIMGAILIPLNRRMYNRNIATLGQQIEQKDSSLKMVEGYNIDLEISIKEQKADFEAQLAKKDSIVNTREMDARRKDRKINDLKNEVEFQDIAINTLLNEKETLRTKLSNERQKAIEESNAAHKKYVKLVKTATRDSVLLSDLKKEHHELAAIAARNDELFWALQTKRPWTKSWFSSPESTTVGTAWSYFTISEWETNKKGERKLKGRARTERTWKKESEEFLNPE